MYRASVFVFILLMIDRGPCCFPCVSCKDCSYSISNKSLVWELPHWGHTRTCSCCCVAWACLVDDLPARLIQHHQFLPDLPQQLLRLVADAFTWKLLLRLLLRQTC